MCNLDLGFAIYTLLVCIIGYGICLNFEFFIFQYTQCTLEMGFAQILIFFFFFFNVYTWDCNLDLGFA